MLIGYLENIALFSHCIILPFCRLTTVSRVLILFYYCWLALRARFWGAYLTVQIFSNQLKIISGHIFEPPTNYKLYLRDDIELISFSEGGIPNDDALFEKNGVVYFMEMKKHIVKNSPLTKQILMEKVVKGTVERGSVYEDD